MLSVKDIQEVLFTKVMGGYKTNEVDIFLDQCADTVGELLAQNEECNNKMQVLAETIIEYRNQEDSIRAALISAQRMADSVVAEAKEKAAAIIGEAQAKADAIAAESEENAELAREKTLIDIEAENNELIRIRQEVSAFRSKLMSIYREHLTLIGVLEVEEEPTVQFEEVAVPPSVEPEPVNGEETAAEVTEPLFVDSLPDLSAFELKEED